MTMSLCTRIDCVRTPHCTRSLPAEERTIPLGTIAQATKLEEDGVEFLLMKALSLRLIEGSIDQVAGNVQARSLPTDMSPVSSGRTFPGCTLQ